MALLDTRGGCKVGWATYDDEAEAKKRAEHESNERERKFALGYDFGFQWPGSVQYVEDHPEHGECWIVTTV